MSALSPAKWFFAPSPPERLAMVRVLVGLYGSIYLLIRLPHLWSYGLDDLDRFRPVGIVAFAETPMLPVLYQLVVVATVLLSFAFLLGYRYRFLGPLYAVSLLFVLTHSNSWGKILHTDNLLVMYVLLLSLAPAADALSWDRNRQPRADLEARQAEGRYAWTLRVMAAVCAIAYLLAGIAKLRNSGMDFVDGVTLRNYVGFDNVRKLELGSAYSPIGAALLPYPGLFAGLAWGSLFLEIAAPFAVVHRKFGRLWAIGIWGFHFGVLGLMAIAFIFQLTMVAFSPFFDVEKLIERRPFGAILRVLRLSPRASEASSGAVSS